MKKVRILVVDDHALFRAGLISLLNQMPDITVVEEAGDGQTAIACIETTNPDVVLLDVNMPGMGGVETVKNIRKMPKNIQPRILMLTISKNDEDLLGSITAGADGYLLKNAEPEELNRAIQLVNQGQSVLSPQVTGTVMKAVPKEQTWMPYSGLSNREMEVLRCLAQGMTTALIAKDLYISENTVKTHVRHILDKLDASNRAEAVLRATQTGLIGKDM